jgi:hypothetical protein
LFCFTATDDVHSWLRLCVAMFNTVNVMAAFRYIDLNSPDLATKQRLIKAMMFDKELEAWTWVRLAAAVRELEARDRPEVGVKPQPVDYSHWHLHHLLFVCVQMDAKVLQICVWIQIASKWMQILQPKWMQGFSALIPDI